jgi:hypothetical protein
MQRKKKKTQRDFVTLCLSPCHFTLKKVSILRKAKRRSNGNSNISPCKNIYNLHKKTFERNPKSFNKIL